jgi:hypothetical protein
MSATLPLCQDSHNLGLATRNSVANLVPINSECGKPVRQSPRGRFHIRRRRQEMSDARRKIVFQHHDVVRAQPVRYKVKIKMERQVCLGSVKSLSQVPAVVVLRQSRQDDTNE